MSHMSHKPIAYTADADHWCGACISEVYGACRCGEPGFAYRGGDMTGQHEHVSIEDNEGNEIGAIFEWDEWHQDSAECESLNCNQCHAELDVSHGYQCGLVEAFECTLEGAGN